MSSAFEGLPKTPNLKLNKPGYDNVADIEALNENADILDEEIQGIKNTFVKSVNGINAGDGGNVDLGIMPISQGGTGASTAEQARTNFGIKDIATYDVLPIANGGTGQTTASGVRNALGLGNTTGAVPIANGGTGATTASQACANIGALPLSAGENNKLTSDLYINGGIDGGGYKDSYDVIFCANNEVLGRLYTHEKTDIYRQNHLRFLDLINGQESILEGVVSATDEYIRYANGLQIIFTEFKGQNGAVFNLPVPFTEFPIAVASHAGTISIDARIIVNTTNATIYHTHGGDASVCFIAIGKWR